MPAGKRTIVKSIQLLNEYSSAQRVAVTFIAGSTNLGQCTFQMPANGSAGDSVNLQPWIVLNAGEKVEISSQHGFTALLLSGSELVL